MTKPEDDNDETIKSMLESIDITMNKFEAFDLILRVELGREVTADYLDITGSSNFHLVADPILIDTINRDASVLIIAEAGPEALRVVQLLENKECRTYIQKGNADNCFTRLRILTGLDIAVNDNARLNMLYRNKEGETRRVSLDLITEKVPRRVEIVFR